MTIKLHSIQAIKEVLPTEAYKVIFLLTSTEYKVNNEEVDQRRSNN